MHLGTMLEHSRMESPAILDVAAHLVGRMEFLGTSSLDQTFGYTRPIMTGLPILQFDDHGTRTTAMTSEQDHVTPCRRARELILERGVMLASREVDVHTTEFGRRQRIREPWQRFLPCVTLARSAAAGQFGKIVDE